MFKDPYKEMKHLTQQNTTKLMAENVSLKLQKLRNSHAALCPNWVNVGNAQIIAAPAFEHKEPPRDLFSMARTVKYKFPFASKELSKTHSEDAYTMGDFELFSPRMKAYMEYCLVIPYALMYKVVARSMELAGLPDCIDANQPFQWFCDLLKERKDFVKSNPANCRPFPTEFLITENWTDGCNCTKVQKKVL
jgi:hypothetical protein